MILIPIERLRSMESTISTFASETQQMEPDVELKLLTNKKFRKRHINVNPKQQQQNHQQHTPYPTLLL